MNWCVELRKSMMMMCVNRGNFPSSTRMILLLVVNPQLSQERGIEIETPELEIENDSENETSVDVDVVIPNEKAIDGKIQLFQHFDCDCDLPMIVHLLPIECVVHDIQNHPIFEWHLSFLHEKKNDIIYVGLG